MNKIYFLELIFLTLNSYYCCNSIMSFSSMVNVLLIEHRLVFDVGWLVNSSVESLGTGGVTSFSICLPEHILTFYPWNITSIPYMYFQGDTVAYLEFVCEAQL